jgi:hypothetical protein
MPVKLRTIVTYRGPIEGKIKAFYPVMVGAMRKAAEWWFKEILPGHFKLGAARKYGYQPRTEKYQKRKWWAKRKGWVRDPVQKLHVPLGDPQLPALVWTGRTRDLVQAMPRFAVSEKSVTLKMSAPRYIFQSANMTAAWAARKRKNASLADPIQKHASRPNMPAEIVAQTKAEEAQITAMVTKELETMLKAQTPVVVKQAS